MTVGELVKILEQWRQDLPIYISSDAEGNSFDALASAQYFKVVKNDEILVYDPFDKESPENAQNAIVLWP